MTAATEYVDYPEEYEEIVPDAFLVEAIKEGNEVAFEELHRRHLDPLRDFITRQLPPEEAEEIAATALTDAYFHIDTLHEPAYFKTWLYRIALNEAAARRRYHSRRPISGATISTQEDAGSDSTTYNVQPEDPVNIEHEVIGRLTVSALLDQEQLLPFSTRVRDVLAFSIHSSMPAIDACELHGLSYATFRQALFRFRRDLRQGLGTKATREWLGLATTP